MTDAGSEPASPSNVAAIVEALDVRARQAGTEGATTVLRGMLGSVSETLASIEHRLETMEARLGGGDSASGLADQVQAGLGAFNIRLGRLEEAFVKAVEDSGSGTQTVVDEVRSAVIASLPPPAPVGLDAESRQALDAAGVAVGRVEGGLGRVEQAVAEAVRQLGDRVDLLATAKQPDKGADVEAALTAVSANVSSLEQALTHSEAMRAAQDKPDLDALFARHLAEVNARVEALAAAIANQPRPAPPPAPEPVVVPPPDLSPVVERIDRLEKSLPTLIAPRSAPHPRRRLT